MCLDADPRHKIGLAISGGLDSTILAYELNALGVTNLQTISLKITDSDDGVNSLEKLNLPKGGAWEQWQHHTATFGPNDFFPFLEEATALYAQPQRMTSFPMYLKLADLAKSANIRVLLSGEGADELFMGYDSYRAWLHSKNDTATIPDQLLHFAFPSQQQEWLNILIGEPATQRLIHDFKAHATRFQALSPTRALMALEKEISLEPLLLRTDICLMSRSIEGRLPFLHAGLPNFTDSLSDETIFNGRISKPLLREIYKDCLPSYEIQKCPFRAPIHKWFTGALKNTTLEIFNSGLSHFTQLGFSETGIKKAISALQNNETGIGPLAYTLISILYWHKWFSSHS